MMRAQRSAAIVPRPDTVRSVTEYPWPESPERTEARVRGPVDSVVEPSELRSLRLESVTPGFNRFDGRDAGWIALRITVAAVGGDLLQREIWNPDWHTTWDSELFQLGSDLEDWFCETSVGWGQQRTARVPD
jgi:hypothetical protein